MAGRLRHLLAKMKEFDLPEHYHTEQEAVSGLNKLVNDLTKAKRTLLITGAGLSTASGIPDYRSPTNTRLAAGAGQYNREQPLNFQPVTFATPSFAHLTITQLVRNNLVSTVITQNVDNLHSKSLLSTRNLVEVHGNVCREYCQACGQLHYRNYYCRDRSRPRTSDHFNGRYCRNCNGRLLDSLVFFGESYPTRTKSFLESISADLVVAIGSSMTIPSLQRLVKKLTANTYVINIQKTALPEEVVSCQIHHDIQDSFRHLAQKLSLQVRPFRIMYNIAVEVDILGKFNIQMFDFEMTPVDCIRQLSILRQNGNVETTGEVHNKQLKQIEQIKEARLQLHCYHGQTEISLDKHTLLRMANQHTIMHFEWNPKLKVWHCQPAN